MRKLIVTLIILCFLLNLNSTFYAVESQNYNSNEEAVVIADVPVNITTKYNTATYTVVIPATLDFECVIDESQTEISHEFDIRVIDIKNLGNRRIAVSVNADGFALENNGKTLPFTISNGDLVLNKDGEIASINEDSTIKCSLNINPREIKEQATYSGVINFFFTVK